MIIKPTKRFDFHKCKASGDASITLIGMFFTLLVTVVFILTLQIQQINLLYEETDEALALSVLSAAVINDEDAYSAQQIVIHELDKFDGDITSSYALRVLGETNDTYLQDSYEYFIQTFSDNFRLDTNLIPVNPLINTSINIVEYNVYNKWYELDENGLRTGNFRICQYSYNPESNIWNTTWYPVNQTITVPDSLTQKNIPVEHTLVSAQIQMTVTKLPYIASIFDERSSLEQEVYYIRNADIKEHDDLVNDREESSNTNPIDPIVPAPDDDTPETPEAPDTPTVSSVTIAINEEFDGTIKRNVTIQNTGNTSAYIRAAIVITWKDANGNVYGQAPVAGTDYEITYGADLDEHGIGWILSSDGFYYWNVPVDPSESTEALIKTCTTDNTNESNGYSLSVEILSSSIQGIPTEAVTTEWSSGVNYIVTKIVDGNTIDALSIK